ncbi:MAG: RluA family pseudouridine synthase [Deltaproteobacteria bacterium]|nr:RluA family pseudouridine synthase [Deltaproteobacteria bacterium]
MPGQLRRRELIDGTFVVTHTIDDSHDGWRADNYLRAVYKHFSRNKLQNLIDEGRIQMPSKRLKASTTLRPGDEIKVLTEQTEEPPVDLNFGTLYEDDHVLVIDKPGNLPVHPAGKFLFNTLLMRLRQTRGRNYHLIHRLDRETSGVLLLAKDPETAGQLVKQFRERRTEKRYWAVCEGHPLEDAFTVDADIGSAINSEIRLKMQAFPKGTSEMDALTHFKTLARAPRGVSLIDCKLETGRQHQIRVHLAYKGHPVVGDKLYGAGDQAFLDHIHRAQWVKKKLIEKGIWAETPDEDEVSAETGGSRQALHSRYLKFWYERRDCWLEVESPLPKDMEALLT